MYTLHQSKSFPQRHFSTVYCYVVTWLCSLSEFSSHIFKNKCANATQRGGPRVSLKTTIVPRCKHWLALLIHSKNSSWIPLPSGPSPLSQKQIQLDCQAKLCLLQSLHLFTFLSVCLKNQGNNKLASTSLLSLPLSEGPQPHSTHQPRQKPPFVSVRRCWAFTSSKSNLFLRSGEAPLLLSACQAPSGGWQAGCQQRPSRPVKGTCTSHFPW